MSSLGNSLQEPPARLVLEGFLSREQLAQQLGLSLRTIDRWEALHKGPPRVCVGLRSCTTLTPCANGCGQEKVRRFLR